MEGCKEQFKKILSRDVLKWVIVGIAGFIIVGLIFGAGIFVGGLKARFSYSWAENYHKNFGGPRSGFFSDWMNFPRGEFIEAHGVFGEIIELKDNGLVVKGRDDVEKIVVTTQNTVIKRGMENLKDGLKVGDQVVIIGSPNDQGQIEAKLIRMFGGEPKPLPYKGPRVKLF